MVWIACTNPAQSLPDQATVRAGLARAELVVLQEAYANTETAPFADVLLPASTWGEKEGTVTNSERRISRVRAAIAAAGEARADWAIAAEFARRLEARLRPGAADAVSLRRAGGRCSPSMRASTRGRDLDITGLSLRAARRDGPAAVAVPARTRPRDARGSTPIIVFATADGRARFAAVEVRAGRRARRCAVSVPAQHRPPARPVARHEPHRHDRDAVRARARTGDRAESGRPRAPRHRRRRPRARRVAARRACWCPSRPRSRSSRAPRSCRCTGAARRWPARASAGVNAVTSSACLPDRRSSPS